MERRYQCIVLRYPGSKIRVTKTRYPYERKFCGLKKIEHHHRIQHIHISCNAKFRLKYTSLYIYIFFAKYTQIGLKKYFS